MIRALLLILALLPAAPLAAQTPEEQGRLDWVRARGQLIFDLDRAAWVATDDMLARIPDAASSGLRGYLVERDGDELSVTFFGGVGDAPVAFYRGRVRDHRVASREIFPAAARPALTASQRRLAAVRLMAGELGRRPCGRAPFNTVVVPPDSEGGPVDLYLLTPQLREREWPAGGHFRATIDAGGSIESSRAFTNSCLALSGADGAVGLVVTHLLDPIPTEIHVFTALTSGLPLYVATGDPERVWEVTADRIRLVRAPN